MRRQTNTAVTGRDMCVPSPEKGLRERVAVIKQFVHPDHLFILWKSTDSYTVSHYDGFC